MVVRELLKNEAYIGAESFRKEIANPSPRLSELERLISKLYEEMVLGDIPREMVLDMVEKYKIEGLDRELLIELVDRIVVGQKTMVDGVEQQEITIIYNLRLIDCPFTRILWSILDL